MKKLPRPWLTLRHRSGIWLVHIRPSARRRYNPYWWIEVRVR